MSTRQQRQQRAREELDDARRATAKLEAEFAQAQAQAAQVDAAAQLAADQVAQGAAATVLERMRQAEAEAARLRSLLASFLDSRVSTDPRLQHEISILPHDALHMPMLGVAHPLRIQVAGRPWNEFRERLVANPAAAPPT